MSWIFIKWYRYHIRRERKCRTVRRVAPIYSESMCESVFCLSPLCVRTCKRLYELFFINVFSVNILIVGKTKAWGIKQLISVQVEIPFCMTLDSILVLHAVLPLS